VGDNPLTYKEALRKEKVRKNLWPGVVASAVPLTPKTPEWQALYSTPFVGPYDEEPMERPDPYGEWVLQKVQQERGGNKPPIPEEILAAARATWPRIVVHATREFERQGSTREAVALAADIWEAVLRSVANAFQRKGEYASSIADLESYLLTAFHHRFHRLLKAEQERREIFQSVSGPLNLDLLETTQNTEWASELERKIVVRQVTDRMDGWTKKVWQARQYGYSWKEISTWLGITEHQAKMKFQYGVERTRANLLRSLKAARAKKPG
jgi:DNA-directed RNA polymerase specialized sigma24 family protein